MERVRSLATGQCTLFHVERFCKLKVLWAGWLVSVCNTWRPTLTPMFPIANVSTSLRVCFTQFARHICTLLRTNFVHIIYPLSGSAQLLFDRCYPIDLRLAACGGR